MCKNATLQCMNFIYFKLRYIKNTTMNDKVYSKISKMNFIYQVIWLMWILKLSGGNSNNKWKPVDHGATFTCLLQLSSHKVKHGPKEHHLTISNSQHQNNHTHETINNHDDPTLPPDDRQKQSTLTMKNCFWTQTARYPTSKLHNTQTAVQTFVFKYSMEIRTYILQNISYKQHQIRSLNGFKTRRKTEHSPGTGVQSESSA
jgi:hypothetical protein